MITKERVALKIFNPLWPVLAYLFMAITTLHMQAPFLLNLHIEALTLLWAVATSGMYFIIHERSEINYKNPTILTLLFGLLFIIAPLLTSLVNLDQLHVLQDQEYITLFEMILFSPCVILLMKNKKNKEIILNCIIIFYVIFAFYFLYRFLILHEVRDFDQRPLLKIRHGDANFLCTFFSMMIPLPLMQAWLAYKKEKRIQIFLFIISSILFFACAFLTESRMGLIAALIGIFYLLTRPILAISKTKLLGLLLVVVIGISFTSGDRVAQRFSEIRDKSNSDRYLTWKNGAQLFFENPIFGTGMHTAKNYFYQNTEYPHFQSEFKPLEVHNTFLKIAAELGISGLVLFSFLFFWPWKLSFTIQSPERFFLLSSLGIVTLSLMTIGIIYKDLFILHLFIVAALALYPNLDLRKV